MGESAKIPRPGWERRSPPAAKHTRFPPGGEFPRDQRSLDVRATFVLTVLLLLISNVFMTYAWYGHLRDKNTPLFVAILVSWCVAFFEYCFQVPANRIGHGQFSAPQLKIIQEVITLLVFAVFSATVLREPLRWNDYLGFALILAAVFCVFVLRPLAH
jgi:uncharacterized protein (DUF486 family)